MLRANSDRVWLYSLLVPVLALNMWCGAELLTIDRKQSVIKEDFAEVNSIRHGLLSVDVWKGHIKNIAAKKISNFQYSEEEEEAVRDAIEKVFNALIDEMDAIARKPQKTFRGKIRKLAFKVLVDTESLSEQSPQYADAVIKEVQKPENIQKMKDLAFREIQELKSTHEKGPRSAFAMVLDKYQTKSVEEFNNRAGAMIQANQKIMRIYSSLMMGSLLLFLGIWWRYRQRQDLHKPLFILSVALGFIVLFSALVLPMIDIDARIRRIDFLLMGEHMQFTNQLLFYRSKSIMQMVKILIQSKTPETALVGFLIFLFSIIFPVSKLSSGLAYLFGSEKFRKNSVVRFFAFQSSKWSMADVMVVAIFMAYIGFNGVLNGQLKNLNFQSETVGVISTNETSLQPGFALFLSYVLYGLTLSGILKKICAQEGT